MKLAKGILASPGIAIGKAYVMNRFHLCVMKISLQKEEVKKEIERFEAVIEKIKNEMKDTARSGAKKIDDKASYILNPQIQLLNDPILIGQTKKVVEKECVNAEWALQDTYEKFAARFKKIKDPYFKDRMQEIETVVNKVIQNLMGAEYESLDALLEPFIVIAHDLTPFDTAHLASRKVLGFVTEVGGKTSHAGIIASTMQIPALVGVSKITDMVKTGDPVIVDAVSGHVVIKPNEDQFRFYNKKRQQFIYYSKEMESVAKLSAKTTDGVLVKLMANIESYDDVGKALVHGAEGVGLYRTEFLFTRGNRFTTEEEQFKDYKNVAEKIAPGEAIIRTFDVGGDKVPYGFNDEPEGNPALGQRAIRYCLENPEIFHAQLRAILRASHYGKLEIMYPMVSGLEELRRANRILTRQKNRLKKEGIPFDENIRVGIMIEVPSAALLADQFARYVDFFSIGTNDLIQYLLAIDRGNERVAHLFQPMHPAVLKLIRAVILAANRNGIDVSICGQMSADPIYALILLGMGDIAHLSMDSHNIPKIKKIIREVSAREVREHVEEIMRLSRMEDIKKYLIKHLSPLLTEGMISEVTAGR